MPFAASSVLVGLMISLGASNLVGQAASGLILIYSRTLKPGEYVKIGDTQGTVTDLGMFATRVETGMGAEVVLPNSFVLSTSTINYSRTTVRQGLHPRCVGHHRLRRAMAAGACDAARSGATYP